MYSQRVRLHSPALQARKRRIRTIKISLFSLIPFVVIGALIGFVHIPAFEIQEVAVTGNAAVTQEEIQDAILGIISNSYLGVFPKSNDFIYPRSVLTGNLLESFKRFKSVDIALKDRATLAVTVVERTPHALWCGADKALADASKDCYFLDEDSYIFAKAPDFSGNVFFKYFGGTVPQEPISSFFMDTKKFQAIEFFMSSLKNAGFPIVDLSLKDQGVYEAGLAEGGKIIFNDKQDYGAVLANLKALVSSDSFKGKTADGKFKIDYIDLQYGNKVFYKPSL